MKPKFNLRIKSGDIIKKPRNKAEASVKKRLAEEREKQIVEAVEWCQLNGKREHAALSSNKFPLIKSKIVIDTDSWWIRMEMLIEL